jgi:hypothetical protein
MAGSWRSHRPDSAPLTDNSVQYAFPAITTHPVNAMLNYAYGAIPVRPSADLRQSKYLG